MIKNTLANSVPAFLVRQWYQEEFKSAQEILELIKKNYGVECSRQAVFKYVKDCCVTRRNSEAMKIRAITGRMDYEKSTKKIDYRNRNIDYNEVWLKRSPDYHGPLKNPKTKQVRLPQPYVDRIREYAKRNKKTISDTLKEMLRPLHWNYDLFILSEVKTGFKPYLYNKQEIIRLLDNFFKSK